MASQKRNALSTTPAAALETAGFFAWRTPLLPFDDLVAWSTGLAAPSATADALPAALARDRLALRERMRVLVARPEVREALFIASSSLDASIDVWLREPESERGQKVERALVRYLSRMAARPTPFGLFAGCSVGTIGRATRLVLGARTTYRRDTRLDGDYLATLAATIGSDHALREAVVFRPSSSVYRAGGWLRCAESHLEGKLRSYSLIAVEPSPALDATLARAADGSRLDALIDALVDDEITRDEAAAYVHELVDSQILVSDLSPAVTGPEPIHDLITQLAGDERTRAAGDRLDEVRASLAELDGRPLGEPPSRYVDLAARLHELPGEVDPSRLFQVDLVKPTPDASLGPEPLAELLRGVALLHRVSPSRLDRPLASFRDHFLRRYEGRQVPLAEALDEESGIGFERSEAPTAEIAPLIDGLAFPPSDAVEEVRFGSRMKHLLGKLAHAWSTGAMVMELDDADVTAMASDNPPPLPHSMAALAVLAAPSEDAIEAGEFRLWLQSVGGPSGANLLGRFCHGDADLHQRVLRHLRDEEAQQPDAIFAEVVHLPEGRVGNVLLRPLLRRYEIPYLGRSGAPLEQQIGIDDLTVAVEDNRVLLRSRRLGRQVIPRLTTAHNFSSPGNLGVYRFLCALQYQDVAALGWGWGAFETAPFLPRVTSGRLVLSLARWRLTAAQLEPLGEARGDDRFVRMKALARTLRLPRWVAVTDGDNILPVDLDNVLAVDNFAQLVKGRPSVTLTEVFPKADELCANGPEGRFAHELVVPLLRRAEARQLESAPRASSQQARSLLPGSDWLYVKLYTGTATADRLLRDVIAPVVNEVMRSGAAERWFFIRYADPDWHVRLRFSGVPERLRQEVLPLLTAAAAAAHGQNQLWKLQLDTYEREIDRYGGDIGMRLSEELFCADSDAVLGIVETLEGAAGADARWRLTLRGMDQLLDDLGFSLDDKQAIVGLARKGLGHEFRVDVGFEKQLGDRSRKERLALEALLDRAGDATNEFEPGLAFLAARSQRLAPIASELRAAETAGRLTLSRAELAGTYLHMHANRLLRSAARAQELVIYDLLDRLYQSQRARAKRR